MGVKYAKEYKDILEDLTEAIGGIDNCYEFLDMQAADWEGMDEAQKKELLTTMADDVFYGLGADPNMRLGTCLITYDGGSHIIKLAYMDNVIRVVHLI